MGPVEIFGTLNVLSDSITIGLMTTLQTFPRPYADA
jgi:hypothetical protein